MFGIKFTIGLVLLLASAAAFALGYRKNKFLLKLVFGKDRFQKQGKNTLGFFLYAIGAVLAFFGLMMIF